MKSVIATILALFLQGCAHVDFSSNKKIDLKISNNNHDQLEAQFDGHLDYYLWGLYPEKQTIFIDQRLSDLGFISASRVQTTIYRTGRDWLSTLLSVGLYAPIHYEVKASGSRIEK